MDATADEDATPWYQEWFGQAYLDVYPHRDEEEAAVAAHLFGSVTGLAPGSTVLDLACGDGRHLPPLEAAGYRTVGMDLSPVLLDRARRRPAVRALVRGDMRRLPFADACLDGVASFFTSFGYFRRREDDRRVLREIRRTLRDEGAFLLDFLNAPHVRAHLVPEDVQRVGDAVVRQRRRIAGGFVVKRIEIEEPSKREPRRYSERVRLYEPDELVELLEDQGFSVRARLGDYEGRDHDTEAPRCLLVGSVA